MGPKNPKQSSKNEASLAGKTLSNPKASAKDKKLAASVLSQAPPKPKPRGKPKHG